MNSDVSPKLAAPGAGLPKIELLAARMIFGRFRKKTSREEATALFVNERDELLKLAKSFSPEEAARQILIKRLRGMEDSSRNWSVYMTLEHLRIVNAAISQCIRALAAGKVPPGAASTAAVKPACGIDGCVLETFSNGCDELIQVAAAVPDLKTEAKYAHPWFGPLDAAAWHAVAAFHMRLHRKQVEAIIRSLRC